jgi:hypothetical protein
MKDERKGGKGKRKETRGEGVVERRKGKGKKVGKERECCHF